MRVFTTLIIGAALCVAGCGQREQASTPPSDSARVVLEVRPPVENAELFIATQAELLKGDAVLEAAAEALGREAAELAPMLTSSRVGESALIELVVAAGDETESAEIANAVAEAFVEWAAGEEQARVEKRYEDLQMKIDEQKEKLEKARVKMLDVMGENHIVDLGGSTPGWLKGGGPPAADREIDGLRTTIAALRELEGEELIEAAVDLGISNETLASRYPELQNLKLAKAELSSSGLAPRHPKLVALDRQLTQLETMLLEAVGLAKGTLETQLDIAEQAKETKEKADADAAKKERAKSAEYLELKMDFEREKQRLKTLGEADVPTPADPPAVVR